MEEVIKEGDKYFKLIEVDIQELIAQEQAKKTFYLAELAKCEAKIAELQAIG